MRPQTCFLPNGRTFTVTPVFGGFNFKFNDLHLSHPHLSPGWSIAISTHNTSPEAEGDASYLKPNFMKPTSNHDYFYISTVFSPPNVDYKPPVSPTREIAKMLWVSLWWYFHEPEPDKGEWRVYIQRDGIFKGQNLLQKLERMGLIASEESIVGGDPVEMRDPYAWSKMFVSRRSFWQIDPRLFLITPIPANPSLVTTATPLARAPPSNEDNLRWIKDAGLEIAEETFFTAAGGPFISRSHIPTYYPPPPALFINSNGIRHPIRPKPPHQGEVFYVRYIPSVHKYISFRAPYLPSSSSEEQFSSTPRTPSISAIRQQYQNMPSDLDRIRKWMNDSATNTDWVETWGPSNQNDQEVSPLSDRNGEEEFLRAHLRNRHSFPAIGCWDGKPFGYFQIYWVKESPLGLGADADNYDRGIHSLYSDPQFTGPLHWTIWLSALVHYCWLADIRTQTVTVELKMDNKTYAFIQLLARTYEQAE